jgi:hypothetical protein
VRDPKAASTAPAGCRADISTPSLEALILSAQSHRSSATFFAWMRLRTEQLGAVFEAELGVDLSDVAAYFAMRLGH